MIPELVHETNLDILGVNNKGQTVLPQVLCESFYTNDGKINNTVISSTIEYLFVNGVDINAKDHDGNTALHCLVMCSSNSAKLLEFLLAYKKLLLPRRITMATLRCKIMSFLIHVCGRGSTISFLLACSKHMKSDFALQSNKDGNTLCCIILHRRLAF